MKILVIDDETAIQKLLKICFQAEQYQVVTSLTAKEGLEIAAKTSPDLIILDIFLPDMNGFHVLENLREWTKVPIIVLSVIDEEKEKIKFLDAGADDYVTKPFSTGELLARVRVAMRQQIPSREKTIISGHVEIDFVKRIVTSQGKEVKLTRLEYQILHLLASHAGKVVTQTQIMREVWNPEMESETNLLRVYISHLRKKLEIVPENPQIIITEPAVGYRFRTLDNK